MAAQDTSRPKHYWRFTASQRFEHIVLLVCFSGLALTGIPQKYASESWAQAMIGAMGGIESIRIIHRILATILMAEAIFHGGVISYKVLVLGMRATMIPGLRDIRDVINWVLFNLGFRKDHPHLPRYNFGEKAEYLAVVWGTVVMIITGFMMWNPIATSTVLSGEIIPAARAAHGAEAVLAVLSIIIWHFYNVHFKRFNRSMFTGKLSRDAMEEEHAEELEAIESGATSPTPPEEVVQRRKRLFWPYAIGMSILLVGGLIWFVTLESSAITTVPRRNVIVYAPQVELTTGDAAVGEAIWPTLRCARCHGDDANGTTQAPPLRGTELTFDEFHQQVRLGVRDEMPAFGRGEIPDAYLLHLWTWLKIQPEE